MNKRQSEQSAFTSPSKKRCKGYSFTDIAPPASHYNFRDLIDKDKELRKYAIYKNGGAVTIDFSTRDATLSLTCAILRHHFGLQLHVPPGHLIPTIPNRVQYLQWVESLLPPSFMQGKQTLLDIGTGPSCIYPMLGVRLFPSWDFIATDVDAETLQWARRNVEKNTLKSISLVQTDPNGSIFPDQVVKAAPCITVCNPPFYDEHPDTVQPPGTPTQLVTMGGEFCFIRRMALESAKLPSVYWFTTLVGRKRDIPKIVHLLRSNEVNSTSVRTVQLMTGGRTVRWAVAWTLGDAKLSSVTIDVDPSHPWRTYLHIQPGRAFANQLHNSDITDICIVTLLEQGWRVTTNMNAHELNCVTTLLASATSEAAGAQIDIRVVQPNNGDTFTVTLKAERCAQMTSSSFRDLSVQLATDVERVLSESIS